MGGFSLEKFFYRVAPFLRRPFSAILMSGEDLDCSRYCMAFWDPIVVIRSKNGKAFLEIEGGKEELGVWDAFSYMDDLIDEVSKRSPDIEPLIGGFVGYMAYELKNAIERLPQGSRDHLGLPDMLFFFPSKVAIFDKVTGTLRFFRWGPSFTMEEVETHSEKEVKLGPYNFGPIKSDFSRERYIAAVGRVREYIRNGDVYQVNLSQRFYAPFLGDPLSLFYTLFLSRPAPFYAYINAYDHHIVSTSMERFLWSDGKVIETRPIKGTRPRGRTKEEDEAFKKDLMSSPKDDAELSMIVDLLRNDLGRICVPGTIRAREHKRVETYSYVHHLVSIVEGEILPEKRTFKDIVRATFPGGSITGCPKIRAMEIIDELEPLVRHVYTGSIGYLGIHRRMDLNIAIRTLVIKGRSCYYGTGGGVVYDSDPEAEYQETISKAEVFFKAAGDGERIS